MTAPTTRPSSPPGPFEVDLPDHLRGSYRARSIFRLADIPAIDAIDVLGFCEAPGADPDEVQAALETGEFWSAEGQATAAGQATGGYSWEVSSRAYLAQNNDVTRWMKRPLLLLDRVGRLKLLGPDGPETTVYEIRAKRSTKTLLVVEAPTFPGRVFERLRTASREVRPLVFRRLPDDEADVDG